jgi:hypothetical protein
MTMRQLGERQYSVRLGAVEAGYACLPRPDGSESAPFNWWVRLVKHECPRSNVLGSARTAGLAVAAIERELLAIRAAIPAASTSPSPEPQAEPQRAEQSLLCKCGCPKLWHVPHHAHTKLSPAATFCACFEFEPVERPELKPSNAELIATIRSGLRSRGCSSFTPTPPEWAALSELERRLKAKEG